LEIADVFRAHGEAYRQRHALSGDQLRVMRAIEACRTAVLGGHLDVCPDCDYSRPAYNSCGNRHCPKCQSLKQARWVERRLEHLLPVPYFHVVFTLPAELRALVQANREALFDLLFASAPATLLDLGDDPERLGGLLGITAVLHTWTRKLEFHPHLHCIVTGGGLSSDQSRWVPVKNRRYLFPVAVMKRLFRGKFLAGLSRLQRAGKLRFVGGAARIADPAAFAALVDKLYCTDWVVYSKATFAGPEQVFRYLGRYTHRVGISNQRLQSIDDDGVRFATKGGRTITLNHDEFIRRFLCHVLPHGFTKLRHFGLHASSNLRTKLVCARSLIPSPNPVAVPPRSPASITWRELVLLYTGVDPTRCPRCGAPLVARPLSWPPPDTS
jgi:hypothetical protein